MVVMTKLDYDTQLARQQLADSLTEVKQVHRWDTLCRSSGRPGWSKPS